MRRPNVIMVISDTLRRDHLGVYGNDWISTPYIDRFAKNALVFENAYTGSFPTVPNRHDIMVGRFTATYIPWAPLPQDELVLAQILSENNYITMMIIDQPHIVERGFFYNRGFDAWDWIRGQESDNWRIGEYQWKANQVRLRHLGIYPQFINRNYWRYEEDRFVARTAQAAMRWIEDYLNIPSQRRKPFFLYVDAFDPHEPWDPPEWYTRKYYPEDYSGEVIDYPHYWFVDGNLSEEELKYTRALYAGEVSLVDRWLGRFFEKIEDVGLMENTIVIFTTDHGFLHGEHGIIGKAIISPNRSAYSTTLPLYEEISHIPLIIKTPEGKGRQISAIVQPADFAPTILELVGIKVPDTMSGKSFAKIIDGKEDNHRDIAFSLPYLGEGVGVTIRYNNYFAYIKPKERDKIVETSRAVDGIEKKVWDINEVSKDIIEGWREAFPYADEEKFQEHLDRLKEIMTSERLYDLEADPEMKNNLAESCPDIMEMLRSKVIEFLQSEFTDKKILDMWKK